MEIIRNGIYFKLIITPKNKKFKKININKNIKMGETENFSLFEFLQNRRAENKDEITHTSMGYPTGAFLIKEKDNELFERLYVKAVFEDKYKIFLTEAHLKQWIEDTNELYYYGPILIDIDLRFDANKIDKKNGKFKRKINQSIVEDIVRVYNNTIKKLLNVTDQQLTAIVTMRGRPYKKDNETVIRDGLHIIFPYITCYSLIQHVIRNKVMKELSENGFMDELERIGVTNKMNDIFDEVVIDLNNWLLYGSTKPSCKPYRYKYIYNHNMDVVENMMSNEELFKLMSIRRNHRFENCVNYLNDKVKEEVETEYKNLLNDKKKIKKNKLRINLSTTDPNNINMEEIDLDDLDLDKKYVISASADQIAMSNELINLLSINRADDWKLWKDVALCLHHIDALNLFQTFVRFSQRSKKFDLNSCIKIWKSIKNNSREKNLGIGSLHYWAKTDNSARYISVIEKSINAYLHRSLNETHVDIARVIYEMYKHTFVCVCVDSAGKRKLWYEFRNHRWYINKGGGNLRNKITTEVVNEYNKLNKYYSDKAKEEPDDKVIYEERSKKAGNISLRLKNCNFLNNIISECSYLFYQDNEDFLNKLDNNFNLIGFENGVYDLDTDEFRDGRPDDYISFTTKVNYYPYDEKNKKINEVLDFLRQIIPNINKREYLLRSISRCLHGATNEELFHFWTGGGGNGKSCLVRLVELSMGEYCAKFSISLLTQKRAASHAANPDLVSAKGKRFATIQEPEKKDVLNVSLMKEISGGDEMKIRGLYQECEEILPQFKTHLICNDMPEIKSFDDGTWRRIRAIEFTSRFVKNPKKKNEFPVDRNLKYKLKTWGEAFISILVEKYKLYRDHGLNECEEVKIFTKEYHKKNNYFINFVEEKIECIDDNDNNKSSKNKLKLKLIWTVFKDWFKSNNDGEKLPKQSEFKEYMNNTFGKYDNGWPNIKIKKDNDNDDNDDDNDGDDNIYHTNYKNSNSDNSYDSELSELSELSEPPNSCKIKFKNI
jgi:P4 family phage/plasmid primase-like protien